jgi:hypothetical protein
MVAVADSYYGNKKSVEAGMAVAHFALPLPCAAAHTGVLGWRHMTKCSLRMLMIWSLNSPVGLPVGSLMSRTTATNHNGSYRTENAA